MPTREVTEIAGCELRELLEMLLPEEDAARLAGRGASIAELARPGFHAGSALAEVGEDARRRLGAVFELARRRAVEQRAERPGIATDEDVARVIGPELRDEPVEVFRALLLDARNRLLAAPELSRGTLTTSLVHPREVFRPAILASAAAIVVVHNHPSGDPEPSTEDHAITRRLAKAGALLGIPLLDHVVIGDGRHVSYRTRGDPALLGD